MTLSVGFHDPITARAVAFTHDGRECASVRFADAEHAAVTIYTTPAVAQAVADAFNAAMQADAVARAIKEASDLCLVPYDAEAQKWVLDNFGHDYPGHLLPRAGAL